MKVIERTVSRPRAPKAFTSHFFLCTFSFFMQLYSIKLGTYGILGFLAPWVFMVVRKPDAAIQALIQNRFLLLMPALAMLSALWSDVPAHTLWAGAELAATVFVGIFAASMIKPKTLLAGLLCAHILIGILCFFVVLQGGAVSLDGSTVTGGIYESKNSFSAVMCLMMLISSTVFFDKGQAKVFRLVALGGIFFTPVMLVLGDSVGAIVAAIFTVGLFLAVRFLDQFDPKIRLLLMSSALAVAGFAILFVSITGFNPLDILTAVGKDATLTGRTAIWQHGYALIRDRPLLGVGYQSFWRLDNPVAQAIWFGAGVIPGSGFNFHNQYIDMTVELGFVGLTLMLGYFYVLGKRIGKAVLRVLTAEEGFALMIFTLFMLRSPLEAGLFKQFNLEIILICIIWIYMKNPEAARRRSKPWSNIYSSTKDSHSVDNVALR